MSNLIITGVIDGPLSGGIPKAIELYALDDIADLSLYGIGSANNGGGSDGEEFELSGTATKGQYIYVASEATGFTNFFGFAPDFTTSAASINGDDAIELFFEGSVVDTFGDINLDGTGQPWEYLDGWAYRKSNTGLAGTSFNLGDWNFSSPNALDGESGNDSASTPFPQGSFTSEDATIVPPSPSDPNLFERIGGISGLSGAEITAFDPNSQRLFVVDGSATVQIFDLSDPTAPVADGTIDVSGLGAGANSVDVNGNGIVAIAIEAAPSTNPGTVAFFNAATGALLDSAAVGALPDMVTFTPDGSKALIANEGEPDSDSGIDPDGSISIVTIDAAGSVTNTELADFSGFDAVTLRSQGVRIFPGKTAAADLEPEYIAISEDGATAYVTLQENNAVAVVNIATATVTDIQALGLKDYSLAGNELDVSDKDGIAGNLKTQPVKGLYQPDAIATFTIGDQTYTITANEGDSRDEDERIKDLTLDPTAFPNAATLQQEENLGRLEISTIDGDTDGDGDFDELVAYGGRSFTIRDAAGNVVFDSGNQLEAIAFANSPDPSGLDGRSDNKGPEPEGVTIGVGADGKTYAFVGLERAQGVAVYDVSIPTAPTFVQFLSTVDDNEPEGLTFIAAADSPNGEDLLVVANEDSKTLSIYSTDTPETTPISAIQGSGSESPFADTVVTTTGIVTKLRSNGFFLQTPDDTTDGDAATSEGIFVFTGSAPTAAVGDAVNVTGEVSEFFNSTQVAADSINILSSGNDLPAPIQVSLPNLKQADLEAYENMRFELVSSGADPLVVIENFNLDRFGQITVAEGNQTQPTQILDPDTQQPEIQALIEKNTNERLLLDDGNTAQNPTEFLYLPANVGDDGDGILDADDTFSEAGPTVRLGSKLTTPVQGVLGFSFGEYQLLVDGTIGLDQASNEEARPANAPAVGGALKVASFNVLNFFTTIDTPGAGTGPNGDLDPRGADSASELTRQTDKLVAALVELDADVIGLQEIENNGTTALSALVDALNAVVGAGTYGFVDPTGSGGFVGTDAITTGLIYKVNTVSVVASDFHAFAESSAATTFALADVLNPFVPSRDRVGDFQRNRPAVAATFQDSDGEQFTVAVNHFKSKGDSNLADLVEEAQAALDGGATGFTQADIDALKADPNFDQGDGQGFWNQVRTDAAQEVAQWLTDTSADGYANGSITDPDFLILGDLNAYAQEEPLDAIKAASFNDLIDDFAPGGQDEAYSFVFDGQRGSLDHALGTDTIADQITGVAEWHINADEPDLLNYDESFNDSRFYDDNLFGASDHDPLVIGLNLDTPEPSNFVLELLHAADQEGGTAAIQDAPRFSAVLNALKAQDLGNDGLPDNTLVLSSGDAFIPGLFFDASEAVFGSVGIADIQIQNELGFDAIALGNHEFDFGTATLAGLIDGSAPGNIFGTDFTGANFPYLSTNLDFSTDSNLAPLETAGGQAPQANTVTSSVVIDVNGEDIGVVGAITPTLASISSSGSLGILPNPFGTNPTPEQLDALAEEIQLEVDDLLADNPGLNKVVLLAHMQQLAIELALAERLENVDIIVAGGSNTRLFDENDRPRAGDSDQGEYPQFITNAGGTQTAVVNTDGSYKYVGRLVLEFDAAGNIIPESYDETVSGAYATDDQGVSELGAEGLIDPEIQAIVDAIETQIIATESNVFGISDVFLNGNRSGAGTADDPDGVRTQETNLGNLTADANLAAAQAIDPSVVVSIKNGGGIRASIGQTLVPPGGSEAQRLPNEAVVDSDGNTVKPEGGISQNDIATTLAFNNGLTLLTVTREELVALLEHGVSGLPGVSGRFPQVSGVQFSFDPDLPAGDRIQNAVIEDENGTPIAELVRDGELSGDPSETFRIVTLDFLARPRFDESGNFTGGGDGYPFPNSNTDAGVGEVGADAARINAQALEQEGVQTGDATFADDGTEQDALAEYLQDNFVDTPFNQADVGPEFDERIQNLNFRSDSVLDGTTVAGDSGSDTLLGTAFSEIFLGLQGRDRITTGGGNDIVAYNSVVDAGDIIIDFEVGADRIDLSAVLDSFGYVGADPIADGVVGFRSRGSTTILTLDSDGVAGPALARSFIRLDDVDAGLLAAPSNFIF